MIIDFSEDGLYKGLYRMIDSEDLRCFYSKKAKERSRLFSKTAVIGATQELFKNMLALFLIKNYERKENEI